MIKHKVVVILLLTLMAAGIAQHADAELRRKKHRRKHRREYAATGKTAAVTADETQYYNRKEARREERRKEREERRKKRHERRHRHNKAAASGKKQSKVPVVVVAPKKREVEYPLTTLKDRYRIDVLAPMYLDELVKGETVRGKIPEKALPGIAFYQGIMIASDSLKNAGFDMDVYIHDIGSASESVSELISKNKMDSTDLIIGAVPSKDVSAIAGYAKKKQVNFISALSPSDGDVTDNQFFTLLQPTLKTHCEWIMHDVVNKFPGKRVTLLYRTSTEADGNAYKYLTDSGIDNEHIWQLLCDKVPDKATLMPLFDTTKPNVVIISTLDNAYADRLLKALSVDFPGTAFEVYGMPTWNSISGLHKAHAYPNLTINVTAPFDYDLRSEAGKYIARTYKEQYGNRPPELVYRGYETLFWYANLLKQYGTIFNDKYDDNATAPFTKFEVKQEWDKNNFLYNENTHVFLSTYQGGSLKTE